MQVEINAAAKAQLAQIKQKMLEDLATGGEPPPLDIRAQIAALETENVRMRKANAQMKIAQRNREAAAFSEAVTAAKPRAQKLIIQISNTH